jgi:MOSC domain-containing protein YiiM
VKPAVVAAIGIAPEAGAPIEAREEAELVPGQGIAGDRYARGTGKFQASADHEVTLAEAEVAEAVGIEPLRMRRNIVTRGASLQTLLGQRVQVGAAVLLLVRPCEPCGYLEGLTERAGLRQQLLRRGGVRARVVAGGRVRVGDALRAEPGTPPQPQAIK